MPVTKVPFQLGGISRENSLGQLTDSVLAGRVEMDLHNQWNFGYIGTFYLGSDQQPIRAIFDTGSTNSWILSKDAIADVENQDDFQPFDPSTSTTFSMFDPKKTVKITFGSGSLSGSFAHDQVTLGQSGFFGGNTLNVKNYNFGLVQE